jgi:hypothetical protein
MVSSNSLSGKGVDWIGGIEVEPSVKREEDWIGSRVKSSPFLLVVLLFFTNILPLSFYNKKPSPFFVHGKGEFIQF